jgi:hypothetical protein
MDVAGKIRPTMHLRAFLFATALTSCAYAQTPPPVAPLPEASALPQMPSDLRMPGADHRECGPSKWSAVCAAGRWTLFSQIDLRVAAPRFAARYQIEQADNGEMHATYSEQVGRDARGGEVVIFGMDGFAYRSREKFADPGNALDYAISTPIMMSQLASLLLDLGVIGPPADVGSQQAITASSATQYIRTAAPRTVLLYGAPWNMRGTARRVAKDKVGFNLRLRFHPVDRYGNANADKTETITLEGTVSFAPRRATLPDSMDLTGWKVMRAGDDTPLPDAPTLRDARQSVP